MVKDKDVDYCKAGKRIKLTRIEYKMSQENLAERAGISSTFLSNIENAHSKASLATFIKIANALDIGLDDIVCDSLKRNITGLNNQLASLTQDCTEYEMLIFVDTLKGLKKAIRSAEPNRIY